MDPQVTKSAARKDESKLTLWLSSQGDPQIFFTP
jgi:hypothetical protein